MRIVMIGSGYVGLVSGACLADFGHEVICVDKSTEKVEALERGDEPSPTRSAGTTRATRRQRSRGSGR